MINKEFDDLHRDKISFDEFELDEEKKFVRSNSKDFHFQMKISTMKLIEFEENCVQSDQF